MQFYPPGAAPFVDNISCDNTHWCASLHINDLECTTNFASCNGNCIEPTNFAFIQTNGVPAGPLSPQKADLATNTPNKNTLMMKPGDHLVIHIWDAPVPGHKGQKAGLQGPAAVRAREVLSVLDAHLVLPVGAGQHAERQQLRQAGPVRHDQPRGGLPTAARPDHAQQVQVS